MKVRKYKLLLDGLTNDVLDELLDTGDVLQYVFVCLPQLALDEDLGEKTLANGQRLRFVCVISIWVARGAALGDRTAPRRGAVRVEVVKHAQVDAPAALVRDRDLAVEHEPRDGELDGERHEQRRRVIDPQGRRERHPQIRMPRDEKVQLQIRVLVRRRLVLLLRRRLRLR